MWLSLAPVKSLRLASVDAIELELTGVRGDRRYYLVDDEGALFNAKRAPALVAVQAEAEGDRLLLRFPDGAEVTGHVELGERIPTSFFGRPVEGRLVDGPWSDALTAYVGRPLRLARTEREGDGVDRGRLAGATLVSTGSLDALQQAAGETDPVDGRRFRMTVGIDGVEPHAEDTWIGTQVHLGGATVAVRQHVGRCAVTTLDPERGVRDLDTLGVISAYRRDVPTIEPVPFGVWCEVVVPGRVAVGDSVEPEA